MRVVAGGSRGWRDAAAIRDRLSQLPPGTEIIHGDAPEGADALIAVIADSLGLPVIAVPARWRKADGSTDRSAGHRRNAAMLDMNPDLVIAFWDGESPGTDGLIKGARCRGLSPEVIYASDALSRQAALW